MHDTQRPYRMLIEALSAYDGVATYAQVLCPWILSNPGEAGWLRAFSRRSGQPVPRAEKEDLWRLYALSRVCDVLLLRFQTGRADGTDWQGPAISVGEYEMFAQALGLSVYRPVQYSPFHHEVVELIPAEGPAEPTTLLEYRWPCLMLDRMIIVRGGVGVTAGTATMLPGVADSTTLYWSHRRKYRPTRDLSHGWGSNSQWRTQFRRDYDLGTIHYFNVDGRNQLSELPSSRDEVTALTKAERIELLVNRCFVGRAEPQADLWPYDDTFQIQLHERTNYGF